MLITREKGDLRRPFLMRGILLCELFLARSLLLHTKKQDYEDHDRKHTCNYTDQSDIVHSSIRSPNQIAGDRTGPRRVVLIVAVFKSVHSIAEVTPCW